MWRLGIATTPGSRNHGAVSTRLLAVPGSHACAVAEAMLRAKAVRYQRIDLLPALSRGWLRITGSDGFTVPALNTFTAAFNPEKVDSSVLVLNALLGVGTALASCSRSFRSRSA